MQTPSLCGLALHVLALFCAASPAAEATKLYVSTQGNDSWSGTLAEPNAARTDGPFASITKARDAVRQIKAKGPLNAPVDVLVRGGTYYLASTFALGPQDSGTSACPVTYKAYRGEKAVLSGGRRLVGWKPYRGKVWQCDLRTWGLADPKFKQLFYNGERQPLARIPNVDPAHPRIGGFLYVADGGVKGSKRLLKYDPAKLDPSKWADPTLAEVDVYPYHNWNNNIISIAEIDRTKHIITLAKDAAYELIRDTRFYIQNIFEELDAPGEWHLNAEKGTLYFWPPDDALAQSKVVAPVLDRVIQMKGETAKHGYVRYVRIRGFAIQVCRGDAVFIKAAEHCAVVKCTITNTGDDGLVLGSPASHNRVAGNDIAYIGSRGILLHGRENAASNNHLHDVGVIRNFFNHAIQVAGRANVVSHNLIHDVPAWGITFSGHGNIIEYNEIHHFGLETNLSGGIYAYALRNPKAVGDTVIRFNNISDAVGYGMVSPGQWGSNPNCGIWLDDMISKTTIYGNILIRNKKCGILIHGGKDNIIENNIMAAGIPSTMNHIRPGAEPCRNRILRNIVYYANADPWLLHQYGWTVKGVTQFASSSAAAPVFLCGWSSVKPAVAESDYNVFFPIRGEQIESLLYFRGADKTLTTGAWADRPVADRFAWWRGQGYDAHSIIADPLFVDAAHDDYRLRPNSPALKLGFKPLPLNKIGLVKSSERATWPVVVSGAARDIGPALPPPPSPRPPRGKPNPRNTRPVVAHRARGKITIDGRLGAREWPDDRIELTESPARHPIPGPPSYAKVCYDANNLYVAVIVVVKETAKLRLGDQWGKHDGAEVCVQDIAGDKPGAIFVLHGFANGRCESVTDAGAPAAKAKALGVATRYAARAGDKCWTAEWAIPLGVVGPRPGPGGKLAFNLGIWRSESEEWIAWVGTLRENWRLQQAGVLLFE